MKFIVFGLKSIWYIIIVIFYMYLYLNLILDHFLNYFLNYVQTNELVAVYDYVIVGAGSAGSVVALRLADDKNAKILVLEAGPSGGALLDIPGVGPFLQKSPLDWQYTTVPQKDACLAFKNNSINWPMGYLLGGTGRLNNMIYARGHPNDFKDWFKRYPHYNYEYDVLRYFLKSENQKGKFKNSKFHSAGGPLTVEDLPFQTVLAKYVLEGVRSLGYPVHDLNGQQNTGFMEVQVNINLGRRWTTAHHLNSIQKENIKIYTNAHVKEILFKSNFEASGVKFSHFGADYIAKAKRAVVLSAGTIGTPKLLMLSGIGVKDHLEEIGIPVKIDLPVGNNLQDHITTGLDLVILNQSLGLNTFELLSPITAFNYFVNGGGPWTTAGCEVIGIVNTKTYETFTISSENTYTNEKNISSEPACTSQSKEKKSQTFQDGYLTPDLELMVLPTGITSDFGSHLGQLLGLNDTIWEEYFQHLEEKSTVSLIPVLLHPKSRGTVRLHDKNPQSKPLIDPNYLSHPYDVDILLKGIELIKQIIATEPLQQLGAKLYSRKFPGCGNFQFDTKDYWECYIRHFTLTSYHPVGTCSMGEDENNVVDYSFKIKNTNKLFVADASVIPSLTSANINAAVIMIAEKVADSIKMHDFLSTKKCDLEELFIQKLFC